MTQGGSLESFRLGLVTRKTNHLIRGLEFGTSSTSRKGGLEMEFNHVANDLINRTDLIRPPPKLWGFLVGEHPGVRGGGPPRFHMERHKGSVSKTLPDLALGVSSICIPYNKTVILSTALS